MNDNSKDRIKRAREEFKRHAVDERDIRDEARKDLDFRIGDQWDPALKAQREADARPALTFDKTHVYIQSIANQARQNKRQAKVSPLGGGATTDVANVINGILRHIQYRSHADVAYDTALDYSAGSSFGFVRAITEYSHPESFDQEVRILPVLDPFAVYGILIPACRGQKPKNAFVIETISREEYKRRFGTDETPVDFESSEWKDAGDWLDGENVRIAEYWYIEEEKKTLRHVQAQDGTSQPIYTDDENYDERFPFVLDENGEPKEREVEVSKVYFCTIDGTRCIPGSETEWPGDSIPIVPVLGQQLIVDGEVQLFSLIRYIRDTQKLINVYESAIAEKIALGNRVPYIGYKGQFKDPKWRDANVKNYAFLEVEPTLIDGRPAPLPQRQQLEEQIQALSMALAQEIENLKSGMGIYDASLGNRSNETSGIGIRNRQQQANITNFHFSDNLERAEWELYVQLLKIIPKIYDRPGRQVRIVGEDLQQSVVVVNQPYTDEETGKQKHYPLDVGDYDVVVNTGPSYDTARLEGAETLADVFKAAPDSFPLLGDLWVGSLDYTWAREAARRLKAAAPQNIVNEQDDAVKIPPQLQQQLQQQAQMIEQLTAAVHQQAQEIETKSVENASRERIAAMQEETKRAIALAQLDQAHSVELLRQEVAAVHQQLQSSQQAEQQRQAQLHEADQSERDRAHQANQATQAQQAQAQQAEQQAAQQQQQKAA